jgi:two-component system OmpR family response regulator
MHSSEATVLQVADLAMDLVARKARRGEQPIELMTREFKLLEVLMRNRGPMTRTMLLERVWDFRFDPKSSIVETDVSRQRAKVECSPDQNRARHGLHFGRPATARAR